MTGKRFNEHEATMLRIKDRLKYFEYDLPTLELIEKILLKFELLQDLDEDDTEY